MIGSTKTWLWWIGGLICATAFGRASAGAPVGAQPEYGIRARWPKQARKPAVTAEQKKRAAKLVDEYMAGSAVGKLDEKQKAEIAGLIKDFGSDQFAVRESASKAILKFGGKALEQLKEALKSKDAEVVQRAEAAIAEIKKSGGNRTVAELRKIYHAAVAVINARKEKLKGAGYKAELQAIALEAQGKKDEAEKKREEKAEFAKKVKELDKLVGLLAYRTPARPVPMAAKYGVRPAFCK
jgi:hypothetical protein